MRSKNKKPYLFLLIILFVLSGCSQKEEELSSYTSISQEEAMKMMAEDDGHIILDVRRNDEYKEGHIPYAYNLPVEEINKDTAEELLSKERIILVYCRSGVRSKQAAEKLFELGYQNVYEFGGILDWKGEIVKEMEYEIKNEVCLLIEINGRQMSAYFANNSSAQALIKKLEEEKSITIKMHDYGGFEKVGELPWQLETNDENITTVPGDVILYEGDQITIYYDENTWNFTRIAQIKGYTANELKEFLGEGEVEVTFMLDWMDY